MPARTAGRSTSAVRGKGPLAGPQAIAELTAVSLVWGTFPVRGRGEAPD